MITSNEDNVRQQTEAAKRWQDEKSREMGPGIAQTIRPDPSNGTRIPTLNYNPGGAE